MTTTIGVLGTPWRASVTASGSIQPDDGAPLDWWVAADDRWHDPAAEATTRQAILDGTPVVETRVRVPQGDVIQRVYAVADFGGLTMIELENDSPLPVAVALSRADVLTSRPPTDMAIQGISLPSGCIVVPIGHHTTIRVALAHVDPCPGPLPPTIPPTPVQVSRGWLSQMEQASRLILPDRALVDRVVRERSELALAGLDDPGDDPVAFLLGAFELTRLGWSVDDWLADIVGVASDLSAKVGKRGNGPSWDEDRALLGVGWLLTTRGDLRGSADVESVRARLGARSSICLAAPEGIRAVAWVEDSLVRPVASSGSRLGRSSAAATLFPAGHRSDWLGQSVEAYHLPAPGGRSVSFALRWHGERPAVLWEVTGVPGLTLTSGADPTWTTTEATGEALWAIPKT